MSGCRRHEAWTKSSWGSVGETATRQIYRQPSMLKRESAYLSCVSYIVTMPPVCIASKQNKWRLLTCSAWFHQSCAKGSLGSVSERGQSRLMGGLRRRKAPGRRGSHSTVCSYFSLSGVDRKLTTFFCRRAMFQGLQPHERVRSP